MKKTLISVIVPVYNSENYLHRCIDSILSQTYTNLELLLIDDGSSDGSGNICDEYAEKDPRVRVFHKENGGVSSARNLGLDHAKGEYISFVDSDDCISSNYLNILYSHIVVCDLSYIGIWQMDIDKKQRIEFTHFKEGLITLDQSESYSIIENRILEIAFPYGKLFHSKIIKKHQLKFDIRLSNYEDHIFSLQYLRYCKTIFLSKEYGYTWHVQINSNSLSHRLKNWKELCIASNILNDYFSYYWQNLNIIDKKYITLVTSEFVIGVSRASVYYLYKTHKNDITCINALKQIIPQIRLYLKQYNYNPKDYKHRIISMFIASYLPIRLKHIIFKHLYK